MNAMSSTSALLRAAPIALRGPSAFCNPYVLSRQWQAPLVGQKFSDKFGRQKHPFGKGVQVARHFPLHGAARAPFFQRPVASHMQLTHAGPIKDDIASLHHNIFAHSMAGYALATMFEDLTPVDWVCLGICVFITLAFVAYALSTKSRTFYFDDEPSILSGSANIRIPEGYKRKKTGSLDQIPFQTIRAANDDEILSPLVNIDETTEELIIGNHGLEVRAAQLISDHVRDKAPDKADEAAILRKAFILLGLIEAYFAVSTRELTARHVKSYLNNIK